MAKTSSKLCIIKLKQLLQTSAKLHCYHSSNNTIESGVLVKVCCKVLYIEAQETIIYYH